MKIIHPIALVRAAMNLCLAGLIQLSGYHQIAMVIVIHTGLMLIGSAQNEFAKKMLEYGKQRSPHRDHAKVSRVNHYTGA